MLSTRFTKYIKGFGLVSAMVFGVILVSSSSASAQYGGYGNNDRYNQRNDDRYDRNDNDRYNRGNNQNMRSAYRQGYQAGLRQARQDARNRYGNGRYNGGYGANGSYGQYG